MHLPKSITISIKLLREWEFAWLVKLIMTKLWIKFLFNMKATINKYFWKIDPVVVSYVLSCLQNLVVECILEVFSLPKSFVNLFYFLLSTKNEPEHISWSYNLEILCNSLVGSKLVNDLFLIFNLIIFKN